MDVSIILSVSVDILLAESIEVVVSVVLLSLHAVMKAATAMIAKNFFILVGFCFYCANIGVNVNPETEIEKFIPGSFYLF